MQLRLWKSYSRHFSLLSLLYFIAACSSSPEKPTSQQTVSAQPASIQLSAQTSAKQPNMQPDDLLYAILRSEYTYWVGSPYRLGGNTLRGIDCSSLVQQVFKNSFNIPLPRTTEYQAKKVIQLREVN
ncbi:C40 family peptidase [Psychromonas sp. KJ10-2]|uniref:C40 family peptidase n=1 Tax=Psychromonas sp. KJ10-2 TaxID=3391822 RepID=UPI0039B4CC46